MTLDADMWKYGDPPTVEELRKHIEKKSRLLITAPGAGNPFEARLTRLSPNEEFVYFMMGILGAGYWLDINQLRILDVLPALRTAEAPTPFNFNGSDNL